MQPIASTAHNGTSSPSPTPSIFSKTPTGTQANNYSQLQEASIQVQAPGAWISALEHHNTRVAVLYTIECALTVEYCIAGGDAAASDAQQISRRLAKYSDSSQVSDACNCRPSLQVVLCMLPFAATVSHHCCLRVCLCLNAQYLRC